MRDRILVVCCTRGRPARAKEMYASLIRTSFKCDVVFCIDHDDPTRKQYDEWQVYHERIIGCGHTPTELINLAFKEHPDYAFYSITNDDVIYETKDWDLALMNPGKISYGDDKCQGVGMPTISVVDGDICRAVGWLQLPGLKHLYGDCVYKAIGQSLGILNFDKNVITNHKHFLYNHSVEKDETYSKTNSKETYLHDESVFSAWVRDQMLHDCEKIKLKLWQSDQKRRAKNV